VSRLPGQQSAYKLVCDVSGRKPIKKKGKQEPDLELRSPTGFFGIATRLFRNFLEEKHTFAISN
jgi:hypothetical protein